MCLYTYMYIYFFQWKKNLKMRATKIVFFQILGQVNTKNTNTVTPTLCYSICMNTQYCQ